MSALITIGCPGARGGWPLSARQNPCAKIPTLVRQRDQQDPIVALIHQNAEVHLRVDGYRVGPNSNQGGLHQPSYPEDVADLRTQAARRCIHNRRADVTHDGNCITPGVIGCQRARLKVVIQRSRIDSHSEWIRNERVWINNVHAVIRAVRNQKILIHRIKYHPRRQLKTRNPRYKRIAVRVVIMPGTPGMFCTGASANAFGN
jgi:hypothetical protein